MKFSTALVSFAAFLLASSVQADLNDIVRNGIPGFFDGVEPVSGNGIHVRSVIGGPSHRMTTRAIEGKYLVNIPRDVAVHARSRLSKLMETEVGCSITHDWDEIGIAGSFSRPLLDQLQAEFPSIKVEQEQEFALQVAYSGPIANPASWGLDRVDQAALPLSKTFDTKGLDGTGVYVYVVDTGLYYTRDEFETRATGATAALNFNTEDKAAGRHADCNGHGTHVAGTAVSKTYGIAKNAMLTAIKVLSCQGSGTTTDIINGLNAVLTLHPKGKPGVVNMSLGGTGASATMEAAVRTLVNNNITVVVAAGNENANACGATPAREPLAITVGATDITDTKATYSNFGTCVDIQAPGTQITSTIASTTGSTTATVSTLSGTSMASPHVAGVAALILQQNPTFTPAQVGAELLRVAVSNVVKNNVANTPNKLLQIPVYSAAPPTGSNPNTTTPSTPPKVTVPTPKAPSGVFAYYNATEDDVILTWQADINSTVQCLFLTLGADSASECFSSSVCNKVLNKTTGQPLLFCSIAILPLTGTAKLYAQSANMDVKSANGNSYTYIMTATSVTLNGVETSTLVKEKPANAGTDGSSGNLTPDASPSVGASPNASPEAEASPEANPDAETSPTPGDTAENSITGDSSDGNVQLPGAVVMAAAIGLLAFL